MKVINGNILSSNENIIVHQVNTRGVMGAGLAKYIYACKKMDPDSLLGKIQTIDVSETNNGTKYVVNIFGQKNYGTSKIQTDYNALFSGLDKLYDFAKKNNLSIAIPYKIGCGLAGGDWNIVYKKISEVFDDVDCVLYKYN